MRSFWPVLFLAAWLPACTWDYTRDAASAGTRASGLADDYSVQRSQSFALARDSRFYIALPRNAADRGMAVQVSRAVGEGLARAFPSVHIAGGQDGTTEQQDQAARVVGANYVLVPVILQWGDYAPNRDRAKQLGGSRMALRLVLRGVGQGAPLENVLIEADSGLLSFTGDTPESLVKPAMHRLGAEWAGVSP